MQLRQFSAILRQRCLCLTILWAGISASFSQSISEAQTPISIPQPQPAPAIAPPPASPIAPFLSGPPDPQRIERAKPRIEVWRNGSNVPQIPVRHRDRVDRGLIRGDEPVVVKLQFHSTLAGQPMLIRPSPGVALQSSEANITIGRNGEAVFLIGLERSSNRGQITVRADGVATVLRLVRAPLAVVAASEGAAAGGDE